MSYILEFNLSLTFKYSLRYDMLSGAIWASFEARPALNLERCLFHVCYENTQTD